MRSKASLGSSREVVQGCEVSFANCFYLVHLIIDQFFCITHATINQTGPREELLREGGQKELLQFNKGSLALFEEIRNT